jgi:RND family efflux transporter MFP subunit
MKELIKAPQFPQAGGAGFRIWPGVIVLTAALVAILAGCGKPQRSDAIARPELPAVQVRTRTVESKPSTAVEEVVGTVRARLRATIEAKTSGRITEIPVVMGQRIHAGELLVRLDAPEIKARLEQTEASLQQAERDWKRTSSLVDQQAATRSEYDAADSRYLVAKASVAEARAMLAYVEILAPFDGVVTRKWVDVGDQAVPGKPLVDVEDPSRLQLEADVPEAIAGKVQRDASLPVRISDTAVELPGKVVEIAPVADPASRTFRVKLDLQNDPSLRSGQFARLAVPTGESTAMRIPSSAVVQRGQMEIVFAVESQRARLHLVRTGRQFKDETEILAGLDPGDLVVVDNASQLVDGQPVTSQ